MSAALDLMPRMPCRACGAVGAVSLVRRRFGGHDHAVRQCSRCLVQNGNAVPRVQVHALAALPAWVVNAEEAQRSKAKRDGNARAAATAFARLTDQQRAVAAAVASGRGHVAASGVAGCGKTTLLSGVAHVCLGRGWSMRAVAFNKAIAAELQERGFAGCASTFAALAYGTLIGAGWPVATGDGKFARGRLSVREWLAGNVLSRRARSLVTDLLDRAIVLGLVPPGHGGAFLRDLPASGTEQARTLTARLLRSRLTAGVARSMVADADTVAWQEANHREPRTAEDLALLLLETPTGRAALDRVYRYAGAVLVRLLRKEIAAGLDEATWVVAAGRVPPQRVPNVLLVDEAQDLDPTQQEVAAQMAVAGARVVLVGDPHQAINGWRGADDESLPRLVRHFGALQLPVSVSWRAPLSVARLARQIVPQFRSAPGAAEGAVIIHPDMPALQPGDMVLARNRRPLLSAALRAAGEGRKVVLAAGLVRQFDDALVLLDMPRSLPLDDADHRAKGILQDEDATEAENDAAAFVAFAVEMLSARASDPTLDGLRRALQAMCPALKGAVPKDAVAFLTVHTAKGLEADRVFLLAPEDFKPERTQEANLFYVAVTRARCRLHIVADADGEGTGWRGWLPQGTAP